MVRSHTTPLSPPAQSTRVFFCLKSRGVRELTADLKRVRTLKKLIDFHIIFVSLVSNSLLHLGFIESQSLFAATCRCRLVTPVVSTAAAAAATATLMMRQPSVIAASILCASLFSVSIGVGVTCSSLVSESGSTALYCMLLGSEGRIFSAHCASPNADALRSSSAEDAACLAATVTVTQRGAWSDLGTV
ncbi:hypothetical protein E2C01_047662 [Portunus trituberculatus]|uniref:Uncharacterized protein n=1 Tax=Portunus trituberculatus TaxID=210409 RepID=A0A5B7G479_PORTR|nr:hypothetical protein [Portunus trituberculatus]